MSRVRLSRPPRSLRRPGVRLDNIAVVPASLLPQKAHYQALANRLPPGAVLVVLPCTRTKERQTLQTAATLWRAKGKRVTVVAAETVQQEADR